MPHDQDASAYDLIQSSQHNDDSFQANNEELFKPGTLIDQHLIEWLYCRDGFCAEKEEAVPWCMAKHRMYFRCAFKRDVDYLRHALHPCLQLPMNALHDTECIYHRFQDKLFQITRKDFHCSTSGIIGGLRRHKIQ